MCPTSGKNSIPAQEKDFEPFLGGFAGDAVFVRFYSIVSTFGVDHWQRKNDHTVTKEKAPQPCGAATSEEGRTL